MGSSLGVNENRRKLFASRIPRSEYYLPLDDFAVVTASFESAVVASISR